MKTKLSKIFLFSSEVYRSQFARSHGLFFLAPVALLFIMDELKWWGALFFFIINVVLFFLIRREYPSYMEIENNSVSFNEYNNMGSTNGVRVVITLNDIKRIEYSQSAFEKLFKVGRMKISGAPSVKVVSGRPGNKDYPTERTYCFYGIRNYDETKAHFAKTFPQNIQKEI